MELLLMVKVNASFRIEEPVLKEIKRIAFNEETTQTAPAEDATPSGEDFSKLLDDESDPVNAENTAAQVAPVTAEAAQQTAPASFCVNCGKPVMPGMAFCSNCGYRVNGVQTDVCAGCGAKLADGAVFCTNCGKRVD